MRRRFLPALTAVLLAAPLTWALPPTVAHAAGPTTATLAIEGRPKPVLGHELLTVVGYLTPVRAGRSVVLQQAHGSSWLTIGHGQTNAKGDYSIRTRAPRSGKEVLRTVLVAADGSHVVSPSLTIAPVTPVVTVNAPPWLLTGGVLRTTGTLSPKRPGRGVLLQRLAGKRWITIATAHLSSASHYAMNALIGSPAGAITVRVLAEPQNGAAAAASAQHQITIAGLPPALTGPFDAVYLALKPGSTLGSYTTLPGAAALAFTDDGLVTTAVPYDGPGALDLPAQVRTGVYAAHDGVVDIGWDTDGTTVTLRPDASGILNWNGTIYGAVDPLNGVRLSGSYKRLSGGSGAQITFEGNGRFSDDGITGDTDLIGTTNPSGVGSYAIEGNTLSLVYDSGPLETMSVYALPQWLGDKGQLVLAGTTFRRL